MRRAALALLLLGLGITPALAAAEKAAAPTVAITAPEPGVTVASDSVEVTASYTALKGTAISKVELLVDTMLVATSELDPAEESGQVTLTWEASGYLNGKHAVVMRVTDTKGRTAKASIATTLQRGLPEQRPPISISYPKRNSTVSGVVPFTLESESGAQVKYVIFLVDNVFKAMSNMRPFNFNWDTTSYLNGPHRLQARAYLGDDSSALSSSIEVRVDNPSGATTMKTPTPAPAVAATPVPAAAPTPAPPAAPVHATEAVVPPARHSEAPAPVTTAKEVDSAEIGAPGTAPYVSNTGDVVQPPTTVLAERTAAGSELKVATVAEAASEKPAPKAARAATVSTPPAPKPEPVASAAAAPVTPAATSSEAAPAAAPKAVAPVQVAALPAPASAPVRSQVRDLPPLGAVSSAPLEAERPAPMAAQETVTSTPVAAPVAIVTAPAPKPATVEAAPAAAEKPVAVEAKPVTPPAPKAAEAALAKPAPVQVALLPTEPTTPAPAPKLTAEAKPEAVTSVIVNGEPLAGFKPTVVSDGKGGDMHLLPLRQVVEQLGGVVLWQHEAKQATVDALGNKVIITVQHIEALVNGKTVHMVVAPTIIEGRTLVQARFLAKALNLTLDVEGGALRLAVN